MLLRVFHFNKLPIHAPQLCSFVVCVGSRAQIIFILALLIPMSIYSARTLNFVLANAAGVGVVGAAGARFSSAEFVASTRRLQRLGRGEQICASLGVAGLIVWFFVNAATNGDPRATLPLYSVLRVIECGAAYAAMSMIKPDAAAAAASTNAVSVLGGDDRGSINAQPQQPLQQRQPRQPRQQGQQPQSEVSAPQRPRKQNAWWQAQAQSSADPPQNPPPSQQSQSLQQSLQQQLQQALQPSLPYQLPEEHVSQTSNPISADAFAV